VASAGAYRRRRCFYDDFREEAAMVRGAVLLHIDDISGLRLLIETIIRRRRR
jgi:hypothetical protein